MKNADNICPECRERALVRSGLIAKCPGCGWLQFVTPHPLDVAQRLSKSGLWFWSHFLLIPGCYIAAVIIHEPLLSQLGGVLFVEFVLVGLGARVKHDDDTDSGNSLDA